MKTLPVAIQVYSVRADAETDFLGTMQKVKTMGYDFVELAGLYGQSAKQCRAALEEAGLVAISAHVPLVEMQENIDKVIADCLTLGCQYLAVPYLAEDLRPGSAAFSGILQDIINIGDACHAQGLTLLYHNHDFEFIRMPDGRFGLDHIYGNTTSDQLQAEPDTCWIKVAGQDPVAFLRQYRGRVPVVHLKDYFLEGEAGKMYDLIGLAREAAPKSKGKFEFRPLGQGMQDIPAILQASIDAGARYVVVEQDESTEGYTLMEAMASSRNYLRKLGW